MKSLTGEKQFPVMYVKSFYFNIFLRHMKTDKF